MHRFRDARDFHRFVNSDDLRPRQFILAARATRHGGAALLDRQPSRLLVMARAQLSRPRARLLRARRASWSLLGLAGLEAPPAAGGKILRFRADFHAILHAIAAVARARAMARDGT